MLQVVDPIWSEEKLEVDLLRVEVITTLTTTQSRCVLCALLLLVECALIPLILSGANSLFDHVFLFLVGSRWSHLCNSLVEIVFDACLRSRVAYSSIAFCRYALRQS